MSMDNLKNKLITSEEVNNRVQFIIANAVRQYGYEVVGTIEEKRKKQDKFCEYLLMLWEMTDEQIDKEIHEFILGN